MEEVPSELALPGPFWTGGEGAEGGIQAEERHGTAQ